MEIINVENITFTTLFVSTFIYLVKSHEKRETSSAEREKNYQKTIDTLSNKILLNTEIILEVVKGNDKDVN